MRHAVSVHGLNLKVVAAVADDCDSVELVAEGHVGLPVNRLRRWRCNGDSIPCTVDALYRDGRPIARRRQGHCHCAARRVSQDHLASLSRRVGTHCRHVVQRGAQELVCLKVNLAVRCINVKAAAILVNRDERATLRADT